MMFPLSLLLVCLVTCIQTGYGFFQWGACPDVTVIQDYDVQSYMGTWYQAASVGTEVFQGEGRCVTAKYDLNSSTGVVNVTNTQLPIDTKLKIAPAILTVVATGQQFVNWTCLNRANMGDSSDVRQSITGTAVLEDPEKEEGKLLVTFPIEIVGSQTAPYWILDTDYVSYSVVYACFDLKLACYISGWILTRVRDLTASSDFTAVEGKINNVLSNNGLNIDMFTFTDQSDCPSQ